MSAKVTKYFRKVGDTYLGTQTALDYKLNLDVIARKIHFKKISVT